ncbi:flagellar biosynthesis anti-sigma factor FlgM [Trichococcus paludicola]|uniref:flagellar biosynthesis anti-sigma factor FlgM n=1 Tax=Trichococcus paludicola TaxID=2052942 RepID=UPI000D392652|nr:flagellar biosynthesis anti-sigma factor FlgM [Trichococcus paludicola]
MKIGNGYNSYLKAIQKDTTHKETIKTEPLKPRVNEAAVKVEISEEAKRLAEKTIASAPSAKAQEIKAAIQNGTYKVSAENIAAGMMKAMEEQGAGSE